MAAGECTKGFLEEGILEPTEIPKDACGLVIRVHTHPNPKGQISGARKRARKAEACRKRGVSQAQPILVAPPWLGDQPPPIIPHVLHGPQWHKRQGHRDLRPALGFSAADPVRDRN